MWRSCSRVLNIFVSATRPFVKKAGVCGSSISNNIVRFKPIQKTDLKFLIAISFPFFWQRDKHKTINEKRHFKKIIKIIKEGKVKEYYKNYDEAEMLYHKAHEALGDLITRGIPSDLEVSQTRSYILDCLANLFFEKRDFEKAEVLFREVLKELMLTQQFKMDDNAVVEISLKLSMIYAAQHKIDDAKIGYQFCFDSLEEKLFKLEDYMNQADKDSLALYGVVSDSYSKFLIYQHNWIEALPYLQRSLTIAKKVYEDAHPQVAVISNDLGVICTRLERLEEALKHFEFAVEICKQCGSPDLPAILYNLGDLLVKMSNSEKASDVYKSALEYCNEATSEEVRDKIVHAIKSISPMDEEKSLHN